MEQAVLAPYLAFVSVDGGRCASAKVPGRGHVDIGLSGFNVQGEGVEFMWTRMDL